MKNKTSKTTNKILIGVLWIVLAMSFYFVYTWIAFNNTVTDEYLEFRKLPHEATKIFLDNKLPSKFNIRYINILASIILFLAILMLLSLIFINKYNAHFGQTLSNIFKFSILIIAPVLIVTSIALFNYSAYHHCYVNEWTKKIYDLLKKIPSDIVRDKFYRKIPNEYKAHVIKILENIIDKIDNNKDYNWVNLSGSWWLVELQILVTVISAFRLNTTVNFDQNYEFESKKIKLLKLEKTNGEPFSKRIISSLTAPSGKNVISWFIFISIVIFLPQFIYIFYINSYHSVARELLSFSYEVPNMIFALGTESLRQAMSNAPSSITYVYYAPFISLCVMSSIIVGFIYFFLNSKTISFSTTVYLITIYILVAIVSLTFIINSQIQFEKLVKFWNSQNSYFKATITSAIFTSSFDKVLNNEIPNVWLNGYELISSIILSYSFLIVISLLSLMQMFKVHKQINIKNLLLNKN